MLSEGERHQLAEIESSLTGEDPAFVHRFGGAMSPHRIRRRRLAAAVVALCGVIGAVAGLAYANVAVVVVAMCAVGVAGGIVTWRPSPSRR